MRGEAGPVFSEIPQNYPRETDRERAARRRDERFEGKSLSAIAPEPLPPAHSPGRPAQQPGQAAPGQRSTTSGWGPDPDHAQGMSVRAREGGAEDRVAPESSWPFKYGTSPNQSGNVPGVPFVSPNGTSNLYGTGGRPVYLDKDGLRETTEDGSRD